MSFLQQVILPHSVSYGYLIEWSEVTIGVILLGGAVGPAGPTALERPGAAFLGAFMTINFHFLMGGWIFSWFDAAAANGEALTWTRSCPHFLWSSSWHKGL